MKLSSRSLVLGALMVGSIVAVNAQVDNNEGSILTKLNDSQPVSVLADEVIAIVGNSAILYSDMEHTAKFIENQRKSQGSLATQTPKEEALGILLAEKLMSTCAVLDSLDKDLPSLDNQIEEEITAMISEAGGIKQLEEKMGKPIYQIRADLLLTSKQQQLAMVMQQNIAMNTKVDYADIAEYTDTIPESAMERIAKQYSYSQIVKSPPQTDERKYAVRERLLEFRKRILADEVSLGVLARLYSMDLGSAQNRGEMGPMLVRQFTGPFAETVLTMKPGEISEIVETEFGFHLIELISLTDDIDPKAHIRHILLKPEFTVTENKDVQRQLDSLVNEINAGNLTFEEVAYDFSDDLETKQNGGKAFNMNRYYQNNFNVKFASTLFYEEELMADARYLTSLDEGEISRPFETMNSKGDIVIKVVRLDKILPAHRANIVEDYDKLAADVLKIKQRREIDQWIEKSIKRVYVELSPEYWDYDLGTDEWVNGAKRSIENRNLDIVLPSYEDIERAVLERASRIANQSRDSVEPTGEKKNNGEVVLDDIEVQERKEAEKEAQKRRGQGSRGTQGYGSGGYRY